MNQFEEIKKRTNEKCYRKVRLTLEEFNCKRCGKRFKKGRKQN